MKMKKNIILILSLLFNLAFVATLGVRYFQKKAHTERPRRRDWRQEESAWLGLRPEQEAALDSLRKAFWQKMDTLRIPIGLYREAVANQLLMETPDTLEMESSLREIGLIQTRMEIAVILQMLREANTLDPPQREKFMKRVAERMVRRSRSSRRPEGDASPPGPNEGPKPEPPKQKENPR